MTDVMLLFFFSGTRSLAECHPAKIISFFHFVSSTQKRIINFSDEELKGLVNVTCEAEDTL